MGTVIAKVYGIEVDFLKDREAFDFWYSQMPPYRREKIDRMKVENAKLLSLGAGILLNRGLKEYGIQGASVFYGENNKPYIQGADSLYFNLSHSGSMAVCAFSDREVGIDIEKNKVFKDSLIQYVFDHSEVSYICSETEDTDERNALFTSLWTKKESIMKYYGKGISMGPKNIFVDQKNDFKVYCDGDLKKDIYLSEYSFGDYQICVCSDKDKFADNIDMFQDN